MNLKTLNNIYFIGIGGIGMSALARYFASLGKNVAGYDKTETPLTRDLGDLGIEVHYDDDIHLVPEAFYDSATTLVVYTPAVPVGHSEYQYFLNRDFNLKKRSEVLGLITKDSFCFAVAGTHGKTTTTCILAHLLKATQARFTAFLGGISEDFNSNFVFEGTEYSVVEADEFDRSFLRLYPDVACITSMDADHLDIYGSEAELKKSFGDFVRKIKLGGKLFVRNGLTFDELPQDGPSQDGPSLEVSSPDEPPQDRPSSDVPSPDRPSPEGPPLERFTYGIDDGADFCIENIRKARGAYIFDLKTPDTLVYNISFNKPGRHNLLNGLVAFAMALETGTPADELAKALATFKGVQRRFSYKIKRDDFLFIDDYAHHPTEIDAVYDALSEMHPGRKTLVVFQPHLYSRTRDFADAFADSLSRFDGILLLDIYPAREKPIGGITSEWLLQKIIHPNKKGVQKSELIKEIKRQKPDILVTLGAGDIGLEVQKLKTALEHAD